MTVTLTALQKQRRDTASNWNSNNTVLLAGEWGIESDTKKFKIGDGTTAWQSLDYVPIPDANRLLTGNLTVGGDFQVNGTTTTVNTSVLDVEDKNITLGKVSTPTDTTADGGGITLKGATDKTFNWIDSTDSWTSSEHITANAQKEMRYADADSSNYVGFKAPATVSSNVVWTLPNQDAAVNGYVLASDGSGNLSWVDAGSSSNPTISGDITLQNDGLIRGFSTLQATYTGSTKVLTVTVASKTANHRYNGTGSSNGYKINGYEAPFITLTAGRTYRFDQADSSNANHPLRFYLEADKTTAYTTGVTTNGTAGSSGAYTQIAVDENTPNILYYQCSSHGYMGNHVVNIGNTVNINSVTGQVVPGKFGGTNFGNSILVGHSTTGSLNNATGNVGVGITALDALVTADNNVAVGFGALSALASGNQNVAVGQDALTVNNSGSENTAVGGRSSRLLANGTGNTTVGYNAGTAMNNADADYNILVGHSAGDNITEGAGNVIIGSVDAATADGDRTLKIAGYDGSTTTTWITGDNSENVTVTGTVTANGETLSAGVSAGFAVAMAIAL